MGKPLTKRNGALAAAVFALVAMTGASGKQPFDVPLENPSFIKGVIEHQLNQLLRNTVLNGGRILDVRFERDRITLEIATP